MKQALPLRARCGSVTMGSLGATEIILIVAVALLLFGAGRIADIGKGLGEGIRNFKKGIKDDEPPKPLAGKGESSSGSDDPKPS